MRAGQLDRRVVVQRKSLSQSGSGEPIESWQNVGTTRWA
jgi:head-tail adaptor